MAFYHSGDAGAYLRVLAPLAPLVYLDVVVDSLLKGLDEQFNSMKYNFADSFLRVVLVLCLLRFFGMESYVCILFFSTIFNAALSLHRLLKVAQVRLSLLWHVALPLGCAALAVTAGKAALQGIAFSQPLWRPRRPRGFRRRCSAGCMGAFAGGKENGGHGSLESRRWPLPPWANEGMAFLPYLQTENLFPEKRKTAAHVLACRGLYGVIRTASSRL